MGTISEEQVQTAAEAVGSYFPLVAACVASTAGTSNPEMVSTVSGFIGASIPLVTKIIIGILKSHKKTTDDASKVSIIDPENELIHCFNETVEFMKSSGTHTQLKEEHREKFLLYIAEAKGTNAIDAFDSKYILELANSMHAIFTDEENANLASDFQKAFSNRLFFHPELNAFLLSAKTDELSQKTDKSFQMIGSLVDFVGNEFLQKLSVLQYRDGIIFCFSRLFRQFLTEHPQPADAIKFLAHIQDLHNDNHFQYSKSTRGYKTTSSELQEALISQNAIEIRNQGQPLLRVYLSFIHAECSYYAEDYQSAIDEYTDVQRIFSREIKAPSGDVDNAVVYLMNAIALSRFQLSKKVKEDVSRNELLKETLNGYQEMSSRLNTSGNYSFIWRYWRNYGACLESIGRYQEAIIQYEKALGNMPEGTGEYKLYITYCSSIMKKWDRDYKKISEDWFANIRSIQCHDRLSLNYENIEIMKAYLSVALHITKGFSDIHVQRAKVMIYEMLLSNDTGTEAIQNAIRQELLIAKIISYGQKGYLYVERDFYYALYLMEPLGEKVSGVVEAYNQMDAVDRIKQTYSIVLKLTEVQEEKTGFLNREIGGNGDSNQFTELFAKLRGKIH